MVEFKDGKLIWEKEMTPEHKPKFDLSNLTVNFRWLLPVMGMVYFYAYQGDMHAIKDSISDLKTGQDKEWSALASSKSKIDCVQNQLAKCCKDSVYCT
jgi:hypothetical protein